MLQMTSTRGLASRPRALQLLFFLGCLIAGLALGAAPARTVRSVIPVPEGYARAEYPAGSYSHYVQHLPLRADQVIHSYSGGIIQNPIFNVWGVVDMPLLFKSDIEQCADWGMRLWAEYHVSTGKLSQLYLFDYSGNRKRYATSKKSYRAFLSQAFSYSNSHSLKRGCQEVAPDGLRPGDMVVQNDTGGIGHVSIVIDVAKNPQGKTVYLMGSSFMPAQEFHLEKALEPYGVGGWFTLEGLYLYLDENLNLGKPTLRRFPKP